MLLQLQQLLCTDNENSISVITISLHSPSPRYILLAVSALQGSHDYLLKHSNGCSSNKTNNASTLAVSVFIQCTSVTEASKWDLLLQSFSHVFAMASGFRCFHASWPIGTARGSLFLAEYAQTFFSIFATYFTFWPISRKWESAKWDLSIGNATYFKNGNL